MTLTRLEQIGHILGSCSIEPDYAPGLKDELYQIACDLRTELETCQREVNELKAGTWLPIRDAQIVRLTQQLTECQQKREEWQLIAFNRLSELNVRNKQIIECQRERDEQIQAKNNFMQGVEDMRTERTKLQRIYSKTHTKLEKCQASLALANGCIEAGIAREKGLAQKLAECQWELEKLREKIHPTPWQVE